MHVSWRAAVTATLFTPTLALGQWHTRDGAAIEAGFAGVSIRCDGCASDGSAGVAWFARLLAPAGEHLSVGGEYSRTTSNSTSETARIQHLLVVHWHAAARNILARSAGLGYAQAQIDRHHPYSGGVYTESGTNAGPGFRIGAKYEWTVASRLSLLPFVNFVMGPLLQSGDTPALAANLASVQFGLGLRWP